MSITRDFMVVTRIAMPSTVSVTVLHAETAYAARECQYQQQPSDDETATSAKGF